MRKILLTAVILMFTAGLAAAQFTAGTKYLAGTVSYDKDMTDYGEVDYGETTITVAPELGYFAMDNLLIFGRLGYTKVSFDELAEGEEDPDATTVFVVGGRYFYNFLYGGAGYHYQSAIGDEDAPTGLLFEAGYMYPVTDFFFVDLGVDYYFGMTEYGVDPNTFKVKGLTAGIGFATFF